MSSKPATQAPLPATTDSTAAKPAPHDTALPKAFLDFMITGWKAP